MKYLGNETRGAIALAAVLFCSVISGLAASDSETNSAALFQEFTTLDPRWGTNLLKLATLADQVAAVDKKQAKAEKKLVRNSPDLKTLPAAELQKLFAEDGTKQNARAFAAIGRLAGESLLTDDSGGDRVEDIREIQAGLRNSTRSPVPEKLGVFTSWVFLFENLSGPIGRGNVRATNLANSVAGNDDGRSDPRPSTFWKRPAEIARQNLYAGFGRENFPHLEESICTYGAPKTSSGTHAGFDVECNGERYKIKFGDLNSEPFTARIFYALGYHADPTDYAPQIKIRYDRRMLREFHLRKPLNMRVAPLGIRTWDIHLQEHYDPFAFITTAVFKDGQKVSGMALKQMLFTNLNISHPEDSPENFRADVEAKLDYLVMPAANVQPRDGPTQSIGSWEFGGLGHENLRELRGAGLLAAWLAWFDSRPDNTKLRIERDAKEVKLLHFISDLGGGMGAGTGFFSPHGENPNDFAWTCTTPEIIRGRGRMTTPFRIEHFRPTVPTPAFAAMTAEDARWMARLIGQFTENQLRGALIASGYDDAQSQLYVEKLVSRRDKMIRDLKLENEIPLLRPKGQNRDFSYAPSSDGRFTADVGESKVFARESRSAIFRGKIIQR